MNRTALIRILISLALAALLIWFFLHNVDFAELGHALAQADVGILLGAVAVALLSYWLRAVRWQFMLRSVGRTRHSTAVCATATGYAAMALLPARAGDIVRPVLLARRDRLPTSGALASMVTERIFDMATVVFFFVIFTLWPPPMSLDDPDAGSYLEILKYSGWAVAAALGVGLVCLFGMFRFRDAFIDGVTRPVAWVRSSWREPARNFLSHFLDGMRVVQRPRDLLLTIGASLIMWMTIYYQVKLNLLAFGLDLDLRATFLLVMLAVIGLAIPTPGGVGGFHKATQIGLTTFFAVEHARATGIAILYHATCFIPITIIGLLCLPVFGLSIREVGHLSDTGSKGRDEEKTP